MINLAAIFNSDRKGVKEISKQWNKATPLQVEEKQEREAEENAIIEEAQQVRSKGKGAGIISTEESSLIQVKDIESLTLKYIREKVATTKGLRLEEYVQSFDTNVSHSRRIYDAIVINEANTAVFSAEIRYMKSLRPIALRKAVRGIREKMQSTHFPLLIVIVFDENEGMSNAKINDYLNYCHSTYSGVGVVFYKRKNNTLEAINEEDLERFLTKSE